MLKLKRMLAGICVFCLLSALSAPIIAISAESRVVRVGCVDIQNFLEQKDDQGVVGYGADYLNEIAKYTGYRYEYVSGTWSECMQWLKEGKIDLLLPAEYSAERAKEFVFSTANIGIDYVTLLTLKDNSFYFYADYTNYNGMTVGMIRGNYLNTIFQQFAKEKHFTYRAVFYDSTVALRAALDTGAVDAIVAGNFSTDQNRKTLAKFGYVPLYFIANKKDAALMREIDATLYRMDLKEPQFSSSLMQKYYGDANHEAQSFTREEVEFIKNASPITVVADSNNAPFEWFDPKSNSYKGVDVDILNALSEISGLKFRFKQTDNLKQSWNLMKGKNA